MYLNSNIRNDGAKCSRKEKEDVELDNYNSTQVKNVKSNTVKSERKPQGNDGKSDTKSLRKPNPEACWHKN